MFHVMLSDTPAFIIIYLMLVASPPLAVIVTLVRSRRPLNAVPSMFVILLGIVMLVIHMLKANALYPMLVTLFGIVTLVRLLQLLNA